MPDLSFGTVMGLLFAAGLITVAIVLLWWPEP
jgi:hypothetical protein